MFGPRTGAHPGARYTLAPRALLLDDDFVGTEKGLADFKFGVSWARQAVLAQNFHKMSLAP